MNCSKIRYPNRRVASKAKRDVGDRTLRPYYCVCGYWHLGHLPSAIRRGVKTRGEIYGGDEAA